MRLANLTKEVSDREASLVEPAYDQFALHIKLQVVRKDLGKDAACLLAQVRWRIVVIGLPFKLLKGRHEFPVLVLRKDHEQKVVKFKDAKVPALHFN